MGLAEAFAARKDETPEWLRELGKVVKRAMAPFDTGEVRVSLEERKSLDHRILWIELENVPGLPFRHAFSERTVAQAYFPEQYLYDSMAEDLFRHFRYRPTLPVDDHIILGEA